MPKLQLSDIGRRMRLMPEWSKPESHKVWFLPFKHENGLFYGVSFLRNETYVADDWKGDSNNWEPYEEDKKWTPKEAVYEAVKAIKQGEGINVKPLVDALVALIEEKKAT